MTPFDSALFFESAHIARKLSSDQGATAPAARRPVGPLPSPEALAIPHLITPLPTVLITPFTIPNAAPQPAAGNMSAHRSL